jgi:hypothetical protein
MALNADSMKLCARQAFLFLRGVNWMSSLLLDANFGPFGTWGFFPVSCACENELILVKFLYDSSEIPSFKRALRCLHMVHAKTPLLTGTPTEEQRENTQRHNSIGRWWTQLPVPSSHEERLPVYHQV